MAGFLVFLYERASRYEDSYRRAFVGGDLGRKKRSLQKHHVRPTSRIPDGEDKHHRNIVLLDAKTHHAWHYLVGNLTVEEAHEYIDIIMTPGSRWTYNDLRRLRQLIKDKGG